MYIIALSNCVFNAGIQAVSPASSRFTTPSPVPLASPLSSSTSPRYLPQSVLVGDGARPVPLMEHIRRLRCGGSSSTYTRQPVTSLPDHTGASVTAGAPLANVGLKDLLLSNDDDEMMTSTVKSQSGSEISPAESCGTVQDTSAASRGGSCDRLFDTGKIFMSENGDRPDSSTTKRSKPAVLLMQLLSRPDDEADEDDVIGGSSSSNDTSANMTSSSSPPTIGTLVSNQSDCMPQSADKLDSVFENQASIQGLSEDANSEQPIRNNLLRVLLVICLLIVVFCFSVLVFLLHLVVLSS